MKELGWAMLHEMNDRSFLAAEGRHVVHRALDRLEELLGADWLVERYQAHGSIPSELVGFSGHVAELPRLLILFTRLSEAWSDPTFAEVTSKLRARPDDAEWQHAKIQLEVARAARSLGWTSTYEPGIPGSLRKGDVLVDSGGAEPLLVECVTISRTDDDRKSEQFENFLWDVLQGLRVRYGVHSIVDLTEVLDPEDARSLIAELTVAFEKVAESGRPEEIRGPAGVISIRPGEPPINVSVFSGIAPNRDLGPRFRHRVRKKVEQSVGPYPAWLRVDGRDGIFALTPWTKMASQERMTALMSLLEPAVGGYEHIAGVIYSSGLATGGIGMDAASVDLYEETDRGFLVRRLLAPCLARETFVLPMSTTTLETARRWATAYGTEPTWLDTDLTEFGLPPLANMRSL